MADAWYVEQRNGMLGQWTHSYADLNTDTIKVALRDEGVTALDLTTHVDLADISSSLVGTAQTITSPTIGSVSAGTFDHADATWTAVGTSETIESLDYYKDSGVASTSPLIMNIDSATGLPLTLNGGNVTWSPNASGVVTLN